MSLAGHQDKKNIKRLTNMKKTFLALIALVAITACSKDEVIKVGHEEISFGNVFIDNSTKATDPSYGTNGVELTKFNVYGTVQGTANRVVIYNGEEVTGSVGANVWSCTKTQYWIPDASYNFAALVDVLDADITNRTNDLPTSFKYDVSTQKDVLYATATATGAVSGNQPVNFTFDHLLAKAFFTFTNTDANANLTVTDIQISGLRQNGTYTVGAATPWAATDNVDYTQGFGGSTIAAAQTATNEYERLILPGTYNLTISFKINDDKGGQEQEISAIIENQTFAAGHVYNFTAEIKSGLTYIIFTINPYDWETGSDNIIQG